jgi:hypothetical protein
MSTVRSNWKKKLGKVVTATVLPNTLIIVGYAMYQLWAFLTQK